MRYLRWFSFPLSLAMCMTGAGMYALLGAMYSSGEARKLGYGDDWLILANPLAALAVLTMAGWFGKGRAAWQWLGTLPSLAFLAQLRWMYLASSESRGLGAALGKTISVILAYATGATFAVSFVVALIAILVIEHYERRQPNLA